MQGIPREAFDAFEETKEIARKISFPYREIISEIETLKNYINKGNSYHNADHFDETGIISAYHAKNEKVSDDMRVLITTAGQLHDIGTLISYEDHEKLGVMMSTRILERYHVTPPISFLVGSFIMPTKLGAEPNSLGAKIVKDADFDNLGREPEYFLERSFQCKEEFDKMGGVIVSPYKWIENTYELMKGHRFYTSSAISMRQDNKLANMKMLENVLKGGEILLPKTPEEILQFHPENHG